MKAWDELSTEKKSVLLSFLFVFFTFSVMGLVMEQSVTVSKYGTQTYFDGDQAVEHTQVGSVSTNPQKIKAMVKGSIYETGSNMTVFGACFDGDGYLLPEANAFFTAWYPNGTIVTGPNASMDKIFYDVDGFAPNGTGRWKIHVTMGDAVGTYLTEMRCELDVPGPNDEFALAYGEWQNPEWVKRIKDSQELLGNVSLVLTNVSTTLNDFRSDVSANFSDVLGALDNLSVSNSFTAGTTERSIDEVYRLAHAVNPSVWVMDDTNPTFSLNSGVNNWVAVDMISPSNVHAVSDDGKVLVFDGEVWTMYNFSSTTFSGVSAIPAPLQYAWYITDDCQVSINGGALFSIASQIGSPTECYDVKVFQMPNAPAGLFNVFVSHDQGVSYSDDTGNTWTTWTGGLWGGSPARGRISQVISNKDLGVTDGFRVAVASTGGSFIYYNGTGFEEIQEANDVYMDVSLLYDRVAYVVGWDTNDGFNKVWVYNQSGQSALTEVFRWSDSSNAFPTGIAAVATRDVWVTTNDPSVFYHYDGEKWEYFRFGPTQAVSVMISFNQSLNSSSVGLLDVVMLDPKRGYAVGSDGLIMKIETDLETRLDTVLQSMIDEMTQVNASIQYKLDNILYNVTYSQLYMETTLTPLVNATYQNTLLILQQLGIIDAKLNQTIELQNATLQIVNETSQDVDELVNRSRRIRAWVTQ